MAVPEVRAAGLLVFRKVAQGFEYLLLRHSYGAQHWTPPKGHVDPGEDEYQAAIRETEEESGLKTEDLKIIKGFEKVLKYPVNTKPKKVTYWLAELISKAEVKLSHEHQDYQWADVDKACELCSKYSNTQELFREGQKYLEDNYEKILKESS